MTTSTQPTASTRNRSRLWAVAQLVIFDTAGPLVAYQLLHSAGLSAVSALVLSGVLPGIAVLGGFLRTQRRMRGQSQQSAYQD